MEPIKRKVYLIKNRTQTLDWSTSVNNVNKLQLTLFDVKNKYNPANLQPTDSRDNILTSAAEIEQALSSSTGKNCLELMGTYEAVTQSFKIWVAATFDICFANSLRDIGDKMKISVEGSICAKNKIRFDGLADIQSQQNTVTNLQVGPIISGNPTLYPNYILKSITYSVLLEWEEYAAIKNHCGVLENMLTNKLLSDCCILTAEKREVKCHKNVLAANSDVFYTMMTSGLQESQTNRIELTDVTEEVVNNFLAYLYGVEIKTSKVTDKMAFELLRLAHKYNVSPLEKDMDRVLRKRSEESFSLNTVFGLYYFTLNIDRLSPLCKRMADILRSKPKGLLTSSAYQDLLENNPREAAMLAIKLMELGLS
ncbi:Speckle-type POZ protein [Orchesella cincta]|uniref:Speckle-type POZ protein n=1 Tax=Orchesella cincta TaxID=48709 RepID=A0A1D2M605_ORCCI|nr:Speckle-type POZ protein [Orchesella cincta]